VSEQKSDPVSGNLSAGSTDAAPRAAVGLGQTTQESTSKESTSKEASPRAPGPLGLRLLSVNIASPKLVPEPGVSAEAAKEALMEPFKDLPTKEAFKDVPKRVTQKEATMEPFKDVPKRETPKEPAMEPFKQVPKREAPKEAAIEPFKQVPKRETPKEVVMEPFKEVAMTEAPKAASSEASKEAPNFEAVHPAGESIITSLSSDGIYDESWSDDSRETMSDPETQISGKGRLIALAAVIALAVVSGAIGGAVATTIGRYLGHSSGSGETAATTTTTPASAQNQAVEDSITRIDAELAALKELGAAESAKINERIEKVEQMQAEPAARLAKLNEAMDSLPGPAAPVPAPVTAVAAPKQAAAPKQTAAPRETAAPKETTASIQPSAAAPKPEITRPAAAERQPGVVEGWTVRDVADGGALIEGRRGMFEVFAGDTVPGLGRVDAIKRQDGRWVVVTPKGLIVAR
jgi:hypothetical protein